MLRGDPRPVVQQVQELLGGGLQRGGQQPVGSLQPLAIQVDVLRQGRPQRLSLGEQAAAPLRVAGEDAAQVQGGGDGGQAPDGFRRSRQHCVSLQGQEGRRPPAVQQPAGVPQPHLVGREQEHGSGMGTLLQPPEPLGKARPVSGAARPDHAQGSTIGQGDGGVQGRGPVPAQPSRAALGGDGRGQPVDDGHGVQALQQEAPPPGGDRVAAQQRVQVHPFHVGQQADSLGGEMEPPGRPQQAGGVGNGGRQPPALKAGHGVVCGAVGHAGEGGQLQPVDEGHGRQPPQGRQVPFGAPHVVPPPPSPASGGLGLRVRGLCLGLAC